ncbi:hypothetical protein BS78_01G356400 [Paspalum vaginatum]|nr:hypothetical protein BS78_01G356400 [Paspalum vaginatum]
MDGEPRAVHGQEHVHGVDLRRELQRARDGRPRADEHHHAREPPSRPRGGKGPCGHTCRSASRGPRRSRRRLTGSRGTRMSPNSSRTVGRGGRRGGGVVDRAIETFGWIRRCSHNAGEAEWWHPDGEEGQRRQDRRLRRGDQQTMRRHNSTNARRGRSWEDDAHKRPMSQDAVTLPWGKLRAFGCTLSLNFFCHTIQIYDFLKCISKFLNFSHRTI